MQKWCPIKAKCNQKINKVKPLKPQTKHIPIGWICVYIYSRTSFLVCRHFSKTWHVQQLQAETSCRGCIIANLHKLRKSLVIVLYEKHGNMPTRGKNAAQTTGFPIPHCMFRICASNSVGCMPGVVRIRVQVRAEETGGFRVDFEFGFGSQP